MTVLLAVLALCHLTLAHFVAPPPKFTIKKGYAGVDIRYKEVPTGICEQNPDVKSYSGYADVAENQHIFFWFFEARNVDPTTAPLTVWINGGPGSSSMIGLFQELGPCNINSSGKAVDNPYSWSNVSNMIFIDQPTQVGLSYSVPVPGYVVPDSSTITVLPNNTCPDYATNWKCGTYSLPDPTLTANSTPSAAPNFYLALQGFMGAFPQYSQGDFFFATESYGGHYGPMFTQYFLDQNKLNKPNTVPIIPKAVLIGNGWFDPLLGYEAHYSYTVKGNPYGTVFYNASFQALLHNNMYGEGNCRDKMLQCEATKRIDVCSSADKYCGNHVQSFMDDYAGRDEYDTRFLTPDPFPPTYYVKYLNSPEVQSAIGAYTNFTESNSAVSKAFSSTGDDARKFSIPRTLGHLVRQNTTMVLYYGDADYNCNIHGGLALLPHIKPQPPSFSHAGYTPILSDSSNETHPRGTVRQSPHFAFLRIYQSGHEVPFYQPELALAVFARVVAGRDIATGKVDADTVVTMGPLVDDYMPGNATVTYEVLPKGAVYDWVSYRAVLPKAKEDGVIGGDGDGDLGEQVRLVVPEL